MNVERAEARVEVSCGPGRPGLSFRSWRRPWIRLTVVALPATRASFLAAERGMRSCGCNSSGTRARDMPETRERTTSRSSLASYSLVRSLIWDTLGNVKKFA